MQTSIIKAPGRNSRRPLVFLSALRSMARILFSAKVSTVVAVIVVAAIWWHNISIADTVEAQETVGLDCLAMLPWGIAWTLRTISATEIKKGGEA